MKIYLPLLLLIVCSLKSTAQDTTGIFQVSMAFLDTMHMPQMYEATINKTVDQEIKNDPSLEEYRPEINKFLHKYMGWDAVKDRVAALYASYLNKEEIEQLIIFYSSPTGQKILSVLPDLMTKAFAMSHQIVSDHQAELQKMIADKMKKGEHAGN